MELLRVDNLSTDFRLRIGKVQAVRGISFHVDEGESVGIVGESGSGKSVSMMSVMRLLPDTAATRADHILFDGEDLLAKSEKEMRKIRGDRISMVFQDPMTSLNPLFTIGEQIMEPIRIHRKVTKTEARARALEMLKKVQIPSPESRLNEYPHELSGGMRQRVMIAIATCCNPKLLIADEPTTALDVTIQAQILELMNQLKQELHTSIIIITHDMGVVANMCSRVLVMYGGMILEEGAAREIFYQPRHPYTVGLIRSVPRVGRNREKLRSIPGNPPDLFAPPAGCPFVPRCPYAMRICEKQMPPRFELSPTHKACCWLLHPGAPKTGEGAQANG